MGLNLEWKRFTTWNMTDFSKEEIRALLEIYTVRAGDHQLRRCSIMV